MIKRFGPGVLDRRTFVKASAAAGLVQIAAPAIIAARGDTPIKIGVDNPLTGTYAAPGKNEGIGIQLAVDQLNAKSGILGRKIELLTEDFDQRRRGHGRPEGPQADRARQCRLFGRQCELSAGPGDGPSVQ